MNTDKYQMNDYTNQPELYNEIIKDWNYRYPKFKYIEYPNPKEESINE